LPGIALFYAGMVRKKSVINTMASVVAICGRGQPAVVCRGLFVGLHAGQRLAGRVRPDGFSGLEYLKEAGKVAVSHVAPNVPESVYAMFQLTFAIITAALVVGALWSA
jgi:Amt family ammonium transporter